jgi:isoquinoline 1-oxidoreductase alpha subunit
MLRLSVNGQKLTAELTDPDTPLLWVLRDKLNLTGTKFGCGIGLCGACTVLVDGDPRPSCMVRAATVSDAEITTIEGLAGPGGELHPLQQAWIDHDVAQCGYCQGGQIMAAAALLENDKTPDDADIDAAMSKILCRCGTYNRIRAAIKAAAGAPPAAEGGDRS